MKRRRENPQTEFRFSDETKPPSKSDESKIIDFFQHVRREEKRLEATVFEHVSSLVRHLKGM
jgi:hypothetical protein